jgi:D-cysteine desulfhydrase
VIAPGGAGTLGTLGYLDTVRELLQQIREGALPEPDVIVVPVASGGTAGGILAGVVREGLRSRVHGVLVADPTRAPSQALVLAQAFAATRRDRGHAGPLELTERLVLDARWRGRGYTWPTSAGAAALECGRTHGVRLESTYTAKAFAAALSLVADPPAGRRTRVLYWHTFSARVPSVGPLPALPPELDRLFVGPRLQDTPAAAAGDVREAFG